MGLLRKYPGTVGIKNDREINALLSESDVLVDGPYIHDKRDLTLRFRGSRNQRVIDLNRTRREKRAVLLYDD